MFGTAAHCSAFVSTGQFNPEVGGSRREGTSAQRNLEMYSGDPCWKFLQLLLLSEGLRGILRNCFQIVPEFVPL